MRTLGITLLVCVTCALAEAQPVASFATSMARLQSEIDTATANAWSNTVWPYVVPNPPGAGSWSQKSESFTGQDHTGDGMLDTTHLCFLEAVLNGDPRVVAAVGQTKVDEIVAAYNANRVLVTTREGYFDLELHNSSRVNVNYTLSASNRPAWIGRTRLWTAQTAALRICVDTGILLVGTTCLDQTVDVPPMFSRDFDGDGDVDTGLLDELQPSLGSDIADLMAAYLTIGDQEAVDYMQAVVYQAFYRGIAPNIMTVIMGLLGKSAEVGFEPWVEPGLDLSLEDKAYAPPAASNVGIDVTYTPPYRICLGGDPPCTAEYVELIRVVATIYGDSITAGILQTWLNYYEAGANGFTGFAALLADTGDLNSDCLTNLQQYDADCETYINEATAAPAFTITTQPTPPAGPINYGGTHTMTTAANATPDPWGVWMYQWYRSDDGINWTAIPEAILATYTATIDYYSVGATTVTKYFRAGATNTNSCGNQQTVYTNAVPITGGNPPAINITSQPASLNRIDGQNGSMSVTATVSAGNLIYQWQRNVGGVWTNIPGKTASTLSWTPARYADDGNYRCVVTNMIGSNLPYSVNSNAATLNVGPPIVFTGQPVGADLQLGDSHSMSVGASVAEGVLSYQWQRNSGFGFQNIPGATSTTYDITNAQLTDAGTYRCMVTNTLAPFGTYTAYSNTALVGVSTGAVFRVDKTATGTGTGLTWANAFTTIQPAIDAAHAAGGGEVWVAGGPSASPVVYGEPRSENWGNTTGSLVMKDNVAVYGGFQGWRAGTGVQETSRLQRNRSLNIAVIDGSASRAGNPAYHVVVFGHSGSGTINATLDGFIIQGGSATDTTTTEYHTRRGGGIYNWMSSPTIVNCIIRNNAAAVSGGGIANEGYLGATPPGSIVPANAVITNCVFHGNNARRLADSYVPPSPVSPYSGPAPNPIRGGGAIFNNLSDPAIAYVTAFNNLVDNAVVIPNAQNFGVDSGGLLNWYGAPVLVDGIVWNNTGGIKSFTIGGGSGTVNATYSDVQGGWPGTGNLNVDPVIDASGVPDLASPAVDAGTPAAAGDDILGTARPQGGAEDMGAYEVFTALPPVIACLPLALDLALQTGFDSSPNSDDALAAYDAVNSVVYNPPVTVQLEAKVFSCADLGVSSIILTATDALGLTDTCTVAVTVTDSEAPVAVCAPRTVYLNATGAYTLGAADRAALSAGSTDNCAINPAATTAVPGSFTCANLGANAVTVTVYDTSGNSSACTATVTVIDNMAPDANCVNITRSLNSLGSYVLSGADFAALTAGSTDNCAIDTAATTVVPNSFSCANLGGNPVTVTVYDASGNSASCAATVTIADTLAPSITVTGSSTMNLECNIDTYVEPGATAADNCSVGTPVASGAVNTGLVGTYTITYTVSDGAGNPAAPQTRTVNVFDGTPPVITLLGDAEVNVPLNGTYTDAGATAADLCEGDLTGAIVTVNPVNTSVPGAYYVTYNVMDAEGNAALQIVRTVNVVDTNVPVVEDVIVTSGWTVLVTFSQPMGAGVDVASNYMVSGTGRGTLPGSPSSVVLDSGNTYLLTWTSGEMLNAADITILVNPAVQAANGNAMGEPYSGTHAGGSIGVPPTITACPASRNINLSASCTATVPNLLAELTATDNVSLPANLAKSQNPIAGLSLSTGITTVTLTVTDEAGNASTCQAQLNVADRTAPTITTCATNRTVSANGSCQGVVPAFSDVTATDNCTAPGSLVITQSPAVGATVPLGATTVTLTVRDAANNTATCTATLTVNDTTAPVFTTPPSNRSAAANTSCQTTVPNFTTGVVAADNCTASPTLTQTPAVGTTVTTGVHTVTVRATDGAGNVGTATATFTVNDTTAPVITTCASNQTVGANASCQYAVPNFAAGVAAVDNCTAAGSLVKTQLPVAGTLVGLGVTTVTITVADASGNTTTCTATLTVNDTTAPVITTCASNQTVAANAACQAAVPNFAGSVIATDNCTAAGSLTRTQSPAAGTLVGTGTTNVTITVRDAANNAATCTATLTVNDTTAPVITTCASNQTMAANASCQAAVPNFAAAVVATDNCTAAGSLTRTQSPAVGTLVGLGVTTVTITVRDAALNSTTCTATLTVNDTTAPAISAGIEDVVANADGSCRYVLGDLRNTITVGDNCTASGSLTRVQTPVAGTQLSVGDTTVTVTVTDAAGNSANTSAVYTVEDNSMPVITRNGSSPVTVECGTTYSDAGATAADNCDGDLTDEIVTVNPVNTAQPGSYTVTYNVTDNAGNPAAQVTRAVNVVDSTNPVITTCPPARTINVDAACDALVPNLVLEATATDTCTGTPTITQSPPAGTVVSKGTTVVTITARDAVNRTATCAVTLTVVDATPPVITMVGASPLEHTQGQPFTDPGATAVDNCDSGLSVVVGGDVVTNLTPTGTYHITYDVTDSAGNHAVQVQREVVVTDAPVPVITLNGANPLSHNCPNAYTDPGATAEEGDGSGDPVPVVATVPVGLQAPNPAVGSYTVTYSATSTKYGTTASATRTVNVVDVVAPVITTCASNQTLSADAACQAIMPNLTPAVVATDNCDNTLAITQSPVSGTAIALGATIVTITVRDDSNNSVTCSVTVTVEDNMDPTITTPPNKSANVGGNCQAAVPDFKADVSTDDNCSVAGVVQSPAAGTLVNAGVHTVTVTVSDGSGNTASATATFTANDTTAPVITACASNQTASANSSCQAAVPDFRTGVTATDNCGAVTITQSPAVGTLRGLGVTIVTLTARDGANNTAACTVTFTVNDTAAPVITACAPDQTVFVEATCTVGVPDFTDGVDAADNCTAPAGLVITQTPAAGTTVTVGSYPVAIYVSDGAGNSTSCAATLTVEDNTPPTPAVFPITRNLSASGQYTLSTSDINLLAGTSHDNCGMSLALTTAAPNTFECGDTGVNTVVLTLWDVHGNSVTAPVTVAINDVTPPVITLLGASSISHYEGQPYVDAGATAFDSCDGDLTASIVVGGATINESTPSGIYTISYNVTGASGNAAAEVTRTVEVVDAPIPVITLLGDDPVTLECPGMYADAGATAVEGDDPLADITAQIVTTVPAGLQAGEVGDYTVNYQVTSPVYGTSASVQRTVHLIDSSAPVITLTGESSVTVECGTSYTEAGASAADACDGALAPVASGAVNVNVPAVYTITYTASDFAGNAATPVSRTVTVEDTTAPVITLLGDGFVQLEVSEAYIDAGAGANDACGGDLTSEIVVVNPVDTNTIGVYLVTYNVVDAAGNVAAQVTRTVQVGTVIPVVFAPDPTPALSRVYTNGPALTLTATYTGGTNVTGHRWHRNGMAVGAVQPPAVGVPVTLSIFPIALGVGVYNYDLRVYDTYFPVPFVSAPAVVQVAAPLNASGLDDVVLTEGASHDWSIDVTGGFDPLVYQWQRDDGGSKTFVNIIDGAFGVGSFSGAGTDTLNIEFTMAMAGQYQVVVTDDAGSSVVVGPATLSGSSGLPVSSVLLLALLGVGTALSGAMALRKRK